MSNILLYLIWVMEVLMLICVNVALVYCLAYLTILFFEKHWPVIYIIFHKLYIISKFLVQLLYLLMISPLYYIPLLFKKIKNLLGY
jgi:hypothetical protein